MVHTSYNMEIRMKQAYGPYYGVSDLVWKERTSWSWIFVASIKVDLNSNTLIGSMALMTKNEIQTRLQVATNQKVLE